MKNVYITILSIIAVTLALLLFVFISLNWYTNHGEFVMVPNVKGKSMFDAKRELNNYDLDYLVVDSTFDETKPPLTVLDQQPHKGTKVKEMRKVYLTLNASTPPQVKIPNIIDNSRRQAELILNSWGLKIGQMILIGINERTSLPETDSLRKELLEGKIGGIILFEKNISMVIEDKRALPSGRNKRYDFF